MFQSKKPKSSRAIRHTRKFCLRIDASRDSQYSLVLNTQLPCVITERDIHHGEVMDGQSFGQNQWKFLLTC